MPRIQGYEDHVIAQGAIQAQANPDDFGAGIGRGLQDFGGAVGDLGERMFQMHEAQDNTANHADIMKARVEWTAKLKERERTAIPGDDKFAERLVSDMESWAGDRAEKAKTPSGQRAFRALAAGLVSEFGQRAVEVQSNLAGKAAVNSYGDIRRAAGEAVFQDQTQFGAVLEHGKAAIDDPKSIFAKVDEPARQKFKDELEQDVKRAASNGFLRHSPDVFLDAIAPEELERFKPWEGVLRSFTVSGGRLQVSPATMTNAPAVLFAAASKNVNPAVLLAQVDVETDRDAKGLVGDMSALLSRYGGDYTKALAAFRMGTDAFDRTLQLHGATWESNLPEQAAKYVETVLTRAGMVPSTETPQPVAPKPTQPSESGLPFFRGLPWQEQEALVKEAVQVLYSRVSTVEAAKREVERQRKENQDGVMDTMLKRIVDPKANGAISEKDILGDDTLEWNQKQHLIDYRRARSRELQADGESRTNPGEVRRLMLAIHAADDDPTKTYNVAPIMDSYRAGRISTPEMLSLRREVEQMKDGNGSSFAKRAQMAREAAYAGFTKSIEGSVNPAKAVSAWYTFAADMDNQIAAKRAKNEDPSPLLDPLSRDYLLKPERLKGFMADGRESLADGAAKVVATGKADQSAQDGLVVGQKYRVNGKERVYLGGPKNLSTSWR